MGQSNSKTCPEDSRPVPSTSSSAVPSQTMNTTPDSASSYSLISEAADTVLVPDLSHKRSRRASLRKSLLNLVKPHASTSRSDFIHSRVDSPVSSITSPSSHSSRRRWRWSKARELTDPAPSDVDCGPLSDVIGPPSAPSPQAPGKGKAKEDDGESELVPSQADGTAGTSRSTSQDVPDRPPTPFPYSSTSTVTDTEIFSVTPSSDATTPDGHVLTNHGLTKEESETSHNIGSWLGGQSQGQASAASLANRLGLEPSAETAEDEVVISPQSSEDRGSVVEPSLPSQDTPFPTFDPTYMPSGPHMPPDVTDPTPAPAPPSRQFPPPGTLVVVQGVVHTTDVPRNPPPPDPPISRSNLSLPHIDLQRRASSTPRPSTPVPGERTTNNTRNRLSALLPRSRPTSMFSRPPSQEGASRPPFESVVSAPGPDSDNTIIDMGGHFTPPTAPADTLDGGENEGNPTGAISSSSIDVLGTLLSVAAAATAASLLTGSSEPIFTSGLAPPTSTNGDLNNPTTPAPNITRPTPTPATGLAVPSFGFGAPPPEMALGQEQAGGRGRDRVRNAWGNLRERLGLRAANPPAANPANGPNFFPMRPDGTPMDAREVMLAEMARAFNLGLGLGTDATGGANSPPAENGNGTGTSGEPNNTPPANTRPGRSLPPEDSFERFLVDLQTELRVALSHPGVEAVIQPLPLEPEHTTPVTIPTSDIAPPVASPVESDMPPLVDVSDSDGEDEFEGSEEGANSSTTTDSDMPPLLSNNPSNATFPFIPPAFPPTSIPAGAPGEVPHVTMPGSASRTEHRPGGGINWWRLYRFPPISAPQAQGISAALNNTSSAPSATPGPDPLHDGPAAAPEEPTHMPAHASTPGAEQRPNVVIPVIVVGLQSVSMNRRREQRTGEGEDPLGGDETNVDGALDDDAEFDGFPGPPDNANVEPQQGRSWHSRAANAIRNLRPGRRGASRETPTGEGPGSRTFLIYVIGGYYPPDHHIVTGANTLDSFEALWELAELLGQVKPPTVSKEEIEKSGLEILKPAILEQYEKDGKVSSNCTEKCLICLDEYEPEDDVRLLNCRHAFHKNCVDKWLQTGRNNCPACRSRGVFTDGSSPTTQAPAVV